MGRIQIPELKTKTFFFVNLLISKEFRFFNQIIPATIWIDRKLLMRTLHSCQCPVNDQTIQIVRHTLAVPKPDHQYWSLSYMILGDLPMLAKIHPFLSRLVQQSNEPGHHFCIAYHIHCKENGVHSLKLCKFSN